jgi:hypothetical protein
MRFLEAVVLLPRYRWGREAVSHWSPSCPSWSGRSLEPETIIVGHRCSSQIFRPDRPRKFCRVISFSPSRPRGKHTVNKTSRPLERKSVKISAAYKLFIFNVTPFELRGRPNGQLAILRKKVEWRKACCFIMTNAGCKHKTFKGPILRYICNFECLKKSTLNMCL